MERLSKSLFFEILKEIIGKRIHIKSKSVHINLLEGHCSLINEFYILFTKDKKEKFFEYKISNNVYDFDDQFEVMEDGVLSIDNVTYAKHRLIIEEVSIEERQFLPVDLGLGYYLEVNSIEVYERKVGKNKMEYEELDKLYDFVPEVYILSFAQEKQLIIYFESFDTYKHFFPSLSLFNEFLSFEKTSLNNFELVKVIK